MEDEMNQGAALERLDALQQDRGYMADYLAGNASKVAEMSGLYARAYPTKADAAPAGDGVMVHDRPASTPSAEAAEEDPSDWLSAPPSPFGYDLKKLDGPASAFSGVREALHAERVPSFVVDVAVDVMSSNTPRLSPEDAMAELTRRNGDRAPEILADAHKTYARLAARDDRLAEALDEVGNDPRLIETLARLWTEKYARA